MADTEEPGRVDEPETKGEKGLKRRDFLGGAAAIGAALALEQRAEGQPRATPRRVHATEGPASGDTDDRYRPVVTPNGASLPFRWVDGVKVMHLKAEPVDHEFTEGLRAECWGYNGSTPGPTIEAVEGDRLRIYVTNGLDEPTTVHWHGILLEAGMDGVGGLTQRPIPSGATFRYEFTVGEPGTFMYHPHWDEMTQMAMGMMGMFVVHPRRPRGFVPDRDFAIMLSEWNVPIGAARPNPFEMADFNVLTMNSKAFPGTDPLVAQLGDKVRMRFGNLSGIDNHPIHLHGYSFRIAGSDGGAFPPSAQQPHTTVLVPTGSTRWVELEANAPGDWAMHCHMTHHIMNQMGHGVPNMVGVEDQASFDRRLRRLVPGYMPMGRDGMAEMGEMEMPQPANSIPMRGGPGAFGRIDMGGMFTIFKVRESLDSYADPGWYEHPEDTLARPATAAELRADGIEV
ncbi:MAG: copper oxidase [Deltaproteobacteria bacterium]|nr:copper oxidase [Deltaproteobacteria bacterium]